MSWHTGSSLTSTVLTSRQLLVLEEMHELASLISVEEARKHRVLLVVLKTYLLLYRSCLCIAWDLMDTTSNPSHGGSNIGPGQYEMEDFILDYGGLWPRDGEWGKWEGYEDDIGGVVQSWMEEARGCLDEIEREIQMKAQERLEGVQGLKTRLEFRYELWNAMHGQPRYVGDSSKRRQEDTENAFRRLQQLQQIQRNSPSSPNKTETKTDIDIDIDLSTFFDPRVSSRLRQNMPLPSTVLLTSSEANQRMQDLINGLGLMDLDPGDITEWSMSLRALSVSERPMMAYTRCLMMRLITPDRFLPPSPSLASNVDHPASWFAENWLSFASKQQFGALSRTFLDSVRKDASLARVLRTFCRKLSTILAESTSLWLQNRPRQHRMFLRLSKDIRGVVRSFPDPHANGIGIEVHQSITSACGVLERQLLLDALIAGFDLELYHHSESQLVWAAIAYITETDEKDPRKASINSNWMNMWNYIAQRRSASTRTSPQVITNEKINDFFHFRLQVDLKNEHIQALEKCMAYLQPTSTTNKTAIVHFTKLVEEESQFQRQSQSQSLHALLSLRYQLEQFRSEKPQDALMVMCDRLQLMVFDDSIRWGGHHVPVGE